MLGYIINFYKYATFPYTLKAEMADYLNQNVKMMKKDGDVANSLLVYGDFDRLNIKKVTDFTRLRDVDFYARRWLGQRQSILVYQLEERQEPDLLEQISGLDESGGDFRYRNFVVLTMITLDPRLHKCKEYSKMLTQCKELIIQQLRSINHLGLVEPEQVEYQIYGSFSSSELIIAWWVNQYSDALLLTDMLRNVKFKYGDGSCYLLPFISFYSIIAQARCGDGELEKEITGLAELKLAFQDGISDEKERTCFLDGLKKRLSDINGIDIHKITSQRSVGEYDYSISLPSNCLCDPYKRIFYRGGPLHWDDQEIKTYISLTHVQLYYDKGHREEGSFSSETMYCDMLKDLSETSETENILKGIKQIGEMVYGTNLNDSKMWNNDTGILENYREFGLRNMIKHYFPETDGLCDTIDLLYSDYINNCSNLTSSAWASDLTTQFVEMVDYMADQIIRTFSDDKRGRLESSEMFYDIKKMSSVFIQMIYHIAQSRRTVFVVPSCHLRYMGQYDMILHAYYGIEKFFIKLAYSLECNDLQPFLVPAFMIDVIPEISTEMYKIYHHYDEKKAISGIFSINMPLGAMTDFLRYSMVVCHETAHFITPYNRDKRNQVIGMLLFSEFVAKCAIRKILLVSYEAVDSDRKQAFDYVINRLLWNMMPIVYNNMRGFYVKNIHKPIMNRKNLSDEKFPKWLDYREEITKAISFLLDDSELGGISKFLNENKKDFEQTANDCLEELRSSGNCLDDSILPEKFTEEVLGLLDSAIGISDIYMQQEAIKQDMPQIFDRADEQLYPVSYMLSNAYREACQDLFMVRVFQIGIVDYLVFCNRHKNDTLELMEYGPLPDRIRIAMVCDYLLVKEYKERYADIIPTYALLEGFRSLQAAYCGLFENIPEMRVSECKPEEKAAVHDKVMITFQNIYEAYRIYLEDYALFRSLFLQQMEDSDLSFRVQSKEIMTDDLHKFYETWKKAVMSERIDKMNADVFSNNVAMIQHFLYQDTIRGLVSKAQGGT